MPTETRTPAELLNEAISIHDVIVEVAPETNRPLLRKAHVTGLSQGIAIAIALYSSGEPEKFIANIQELTAALNRYDP